MLDLIPFPLPLFPLVLGFLAGGVVLGIEVAHIHRTHAPDETTWWAWVAIMVAIAIGCGVELATQRAGYSCTWSC
jgi:hypothetical protein